MAGPLPEPPKNNRLQRTRISSSPGFFFLQAVNAGEASLGLTGQVFVSLLVAFAPPGASARGAGPKRLPHSLFPLTLIVGTVNIGFVTFLYGADCGVGAGIGLVPARV